MAKLYKLTDVDRYTRNNTKWGKNVTHTTDGSGELCGPGWLHAYTDPLLAVLLNPIHCNYSRFRLWEAEGEIGKNDKGLKVGTRSLTTIREIPIPKITTKQKIRFAILCAMAVYKDETWTDWANNWLSGKDRSAATAVVAAEAAETAAVAEAAAAVAARAAYGAEAAAVVAAGAAARAARAAEAAAAVAARAAARAAYGAAEAAAAETAAARAEAAAVVAAGAAAAEAYGAETAAEAAAVAAYGAETAAVAASKTLDLIAIAHKAVDDG